MRALRVYGKGDYRLEDVPEPRAGPGEVKVAVHYCGICTSDVHDYVHGPKLLPVGKPHPGSGKMAPITAGHEFSGEVVAIGPGVTSVAAGDRVAVRPTMPCYRCRYCREGRYIQCSILAAVGGAADGAFAKYAVVREDCICKLPAGLSFEAAAYAEPLACAVRGVHRSRLEPGAFVAVVGAGTIGLLTMQVAAACGAQAVHVFEPVPGRRERALRLGATSVSDPGEQDPGKRIAALTGGRRADIAFECGGTSSAMRTADAVCGRGGTIVELGVQREPFSFDFFELFFREKTIVTSQGYTNGEFETAVGFLGAGKIDVHPIMTSAMIPLAEILPQGFEALIGPQHESHCKILVAPGD